MCPMNFTSKTSLQRGPANTALQRLCLHSPVHSWSFSLSQDGIHFPSKWARGFISFDHFTDRQSKKCNFLKNNSGPLSTVCKSQNHSLWFSAYFNDIQDISLELDISMMENKKRLLPGAMPQLLHYFPSTSGKQDLWSWGWRCHFLIQTTK